MANSRSGGAAAEKADLRHDKTVAEHAASRNWPVFAALVLALLLIFSFANLIITSGMNSRFSDNSGPTAQDLAAGKKVPGPVKATLIVDLGCKDCSNPGLLEEALKNAGVAFSESQTYPFSGQTGSELMAKYNVTKVPAIILSKEFGDYGQLASSWPQIGSVEPDGAYVLRKIQPPYLDISTKKVVGRVRLVELVDANCTECYDVSLHRSITPRFGIANFTSMDRYDINSTKGAELAAKYNITKVPTILLSPEASKYESLGAVWPQVGSVENDGWYVFRAAEGMGAYKDLASGKVVSQTAAK